MGPPTNHQVSTRAPPLPPKMRATVVKKIAEQTPPFISTGTDKIPNWMKQRQGEIEELQDKILNLLRSSNTAMDGVVQSGKQAWWFSKLWRRLGMPNRHVLKAAVDGLEGRGLVETRYVRRGEAGYRCVRFIYLPRSGFSVSRASWWLRRQRRSDFYVGRLLERRVRSVVNGIRSPCRGVDVEFIDGDGLRVRVECKNRVNPVGLEIRSQLLRWYQDCDRLILIVSWAWGSLKRWCRRMKIRLVELRRQVYPVDYSFFRLVRGRGGLGRGECSQAFARELSLSSSLGWLWDVARFQGVSFRLRLRGCIKSKNGGGGL